MKKILVLSAVALVAFCLAQSTTQNGPPLDLSNYELIFDENFDTLDVSPRGPGTRWTSRMPSGDHFGDAEFVAPKPGFPFSIDNGVLRIEARKGRDAKWRSGLLASVDPEGNGFAEPFGYFEMRARLPAGHGVWPAFWLLGIGHAAYQPEIDVMEFYGRAPGEYESSVHLWDLRNKSKSRSEGVGVAVAPGTLSDAFHSYGAKIGTDSVHFFFDRREVQKLPITPEFHQPMYILLDLALGGGWPIDHVPNPSAMYVDYVRAWHKMR